LTVASSSVLSVSIPAATANMSSASVASNVSATTPSPSVTSATPPATNVSSPPPTTPANNNSSKSGNTVVVTDPTKEEKNASNIEAKIEISIAKQGGVTQCIHVSLGLTTQRLTLCNFAKSKNKKNKNQQKKLCEIFLENLQRKTLAYFAE
jgi:hypothetical protein